jgi:P4 family phage/plasmid primase-like protien
MADDRDTKVHRLTPAARIEASMQVFAGESGAGEKETGSDEFFDGLILDRFLAEYGPNWRYVHEWGRWLLWSGHHWRYEITQLVKDQLTQCCAKMARERGKTISGSRVRVLEELAEAHRLVALTGDVFDTDLLALNTRSGTVDLRSGALRSFERNDYITKVANASPSGECPLWREFVHKITGGDVELQAYLQRVAGYCLTGETKEQVFFFAHGAGGNGKSTFVNVLTSLLGDYARTVPSEIFMQSKVERHPTELAGLRGFRLVTAVEVPRGARWHETRIKMLTGGEKVSARFLYQDYFEYQPQFKLLIVGNSKPALKGVDEAMRRRLHLLPFTAVIPASERDPDLLGKLLAERDGILAWGIEGAVDWQREGLSAPASVRAATDDYLADQDTVGRWLSERCCLDGQRRTPTKALFESWKAWAEANGEFVGSQRQLTQALENLGLKYDRGRQNRAIVGVGLNEVGDA